MEKKYDFVVIGSGLGGLVSALILAKHGKKVCVLEKNQQFGGNLQTFSRDKTLFDTGVHYIGGLCKSQNLYQYFRYLGIFDDLKLEKMDEVFDKICFENDENEYPISQGKQSFVQNLLPFFPDEKNNLEIYLEKIEAMCNKFPGYFLDSKDVYDESTLSENALDFINSVTDNQKLKAVLAGNSFLYAGNHKTPLYVLSLTFYSYLQSAYKCSKGGSQITKLLIRELRKYDAEVFKRTAVVKLEKSESGKIISAKTKEGTSFFADHFISNIDISGTIELAGKDSFKQAFVSRINSLKPQISTFSLYLVLKENSFPNFNYNFYYHKNQNVLNQEKSEEWPGFYMFSTTKNPKNQEFAESISILTYMDFSEVEHWQDSHNTIANPNERNNDYEIFKQQKTEKLLAEVEKKFPNIRESIKEIYSSSPLSYRDYIGVSNGALYGYEKDSENPYKTMFSPKTKIENLFLTGQTVNMHGILGVTVGAFRTCGEILGFDIMNNAAK